MRIEEPDFSNEPYHVWYRVPGDETWHHRGFQDKMVALEFYHGLGSWGQVSDLQFKES